MLIVYLILYFYFFVGRDSNTQDSSGYMATYVAGTVSSVNEGGCDCGGGGGCGGGCGGG